MSRYGTQDLAGNVKEWSWNEAGGARRYTLGGGWSDPAYFFNDADARSPWDRAPALGFRCMKLTPGHETLAEGLMAPSSSFSGISASSALCPMKSSERIVECTL